MSRLLTLLLIILTGCSGLINHSNSQNWALKQDCVYFSGTEKGTEVISVQQSSLRAVLSNYKTGQIDLLDLSQMGHIKRSARFSIFLNEGEELTSVAFHPQLNIFAAVIDSGLTQGRLQLHSTSDGSLIQRIPVGSGPDSVVFSKDGSLIAIANEGEDFGFDKTTKNFFSAEGSITIARLNNDGLIVENFELDLADVRHRQGFIVEEKGHYLERAIDWNGDGKISDQVDFDGNGKIDNKKVKLGSFDGVDVFGNEKKGERRILIPITENAKTLLEPEYIALSPNGTKAYVTLQETNEVAEIDISQKRVLGYFNMGIATHEADHKSDGWVKFSDQIDALKEPDGIALTPDGRYFLTADEGDTDSGMDEKPAHESGGRTVSVFDAETGEFVADTGNQLDELAFLNHTYPDRRSNSKGVEPEGIVSFEMAGQFWAAVGLERADAVALISLEDPYSPEVVSMGKIPGEESRAPEGLAHFERDGQHYILSANEMNGTVACFKIVPKNSRDAEELR